MAADDVFHRAFEFWRTGGVRLLPAATDAAIEETFGQLNVRLTGDVRRLYHSVGGFSDYDTTAGSLWSLWSLDRIRQENQGRGGALPWFADSMIFSHMYCLEYRNPEHSAVLIDRNSDPPYEIAGSVIEFLERYLQNPDDVEA